MLTPNDMANLIDSISYKKGYRAGLRKDRDGNRWYVQVEFERPDIVTGEMGIGKSGKRYVSEHMSKSEFVALVFGTFRALEEHECREMFKYRGRRIFGPHIDVDALWEVSRKVDVRER